MTKPSLFGFCISFAIRHENVEPTLFTTGRNKIFNVVAEEEFFAYIFNLYTLDYNREILVRIDVIV